MCDLFGQGHLSLVRHVMSWALTFDPTLLIHSGHIFNNSILQCLLAWATLLIRQFHAYSTLASVGQVLDV